MFQEQGPLEVARYWVLPPSADVASHLEGKTFDFPQLSQKNEGASRARVGVESLLAAFRSIELVSIILRLIRPESFGILNLPLSASWMFDAVATLSKPI